MIRSDASLIVQAATVFAAGIAAPPALRELLITQALKTQNYNSLVDIVSNFMNARQQRESTASLIQEMALSGFGVKLSSQTLNALVARVDAGELSFGGVLVLALTAVTDITLMQTLRNKLAAAELFTDQLVSVNKTTDYASAQTFAAAREWLSGIGTDTASSQAARASVQALLQKFDKASVRSVATDGYVTGATVFIDTNANGIKDSGEVTTTTDANGQFQFAGDTPAGTLVLTGGKDLATGQPMTLTMKAPAGATVISPFSTLVQTLLSRGLAVSSAEAESKLMAGLGLVSLDLSTYDPLAAALQENATQQDKIKAVNVQFKATLVMNLLAVAQSILEPMVGKTAQTQADLLLVMASRIASAGSTVDSFLSARALTELVLATVVEVKGLAAAQTLLADTAVVKNLDAAGDVLLMVNNLALQASRAFESGATVSLVDALSDIFKLQTLTQSYFVSALQTVVQNGSAVGFLKNFPLLAVLDVVKAGMLTSTLSTSDGSAISNLPLVPAPAPIPTPPPPEPTLTVSVSTDTPPKISFGGSTTGDIYLATTGNTGTFTRDGVAAPQTIAAVDLKIIELGADDTVLVLASKLISLNVDGQAGNDKIVLADMANDDAAVLTLTDVEAVDGGSQADRITVVSATGVAIDGKAGNDRITGGSGQDTLTLGLGDDTVVGNANINAIDTLTDFKTAGTDTISSGLSAGTVTRLTVTTADVGTLATSISAAATAAGNPLFNPRQVYLVTVTSGTAAGVYAFQNKGNTPNAVDAGDLIVKLGTPVLPYAGTLLATDFVNEHLVPLATGAYNGITGLNDEFSLPASATTLLQGITINGNAGDNDALTLNVGGTIALNNGGTGGTISNVKVLYLAHTAPTTLTFAAGAGGTSSGVTTIYGGAGQDSVDLGNTGTTFLAGDVHLGQGQNTVLLQGGAAYTGRFSSGTGTTDTLTIKNGTDISGATVSGFETLHVEATSVGAPVALTMTTAQLNAFSNITTNGGRETLNLTTAGTIVAPALFEHFNLGNGTNTFTPDVNTLSVVGGTGTDTFNYSAEKTSNSDLDGGQGQDTLNIGAMFANTNISTRVTGIETINVQGSSGIGYNFGNANGAGITLNFSKGATEDYIYLGTGGQTLNVLGTATTASRIYGGPGVDTINLSQSGTATAIIRANFSNNNTVDTISGFKAASHFFSTGVAAGSLSSYIIGSADTANYIAAMTAGLSVVLNSTAQAYVITVQAGSAQGQYLFQNTGGNTAQFDNTDFFVKLVGVVGTLSTANLTV